MKMIIAIIENNLSRDVSKALRAEGFRLTRMAATGGFLREGATTLMIGTQDEEVETVLGIIRKQIPTEKETDKQHATIFVIDVKNFQRI
ncbi:MAG TPA: hypothetical protein EYP88_03570 [Anaerolineales bacterium]|nr:hypothetical protein [Anaerolineales bacterium]